MQGKFSLFLVAIYSLFLTIITGTCEAAYHVSLTELTNMSLEELLSIEVEQGGTLSQSTPRDTPAAMTTITADMIRQSGARSLAKVLEIYVPNLEVARNYFGPEAIGIRGIIGNSNDKILLLVNGKIMNHRLQAGAFSELDLPMMEDIESINVVRGPGSVVYGPGAVAGVISIITRNGEEYNGFDVNVRQGAIERFTSLEMRGGYSFENGVSFFLDYGLTDYAGADQDDSPYVFGKSFYTPDGMYWIKSGKDVPFHIDNDHKGYRSAVKHKVHAQIDWGGLQAWIRYTSGGNHVDQLRQQLASPPIGKFPVTGQFSLDAVPGRGFGYQQLTLLGRYEYQFMPGFKGILTLSYDMFDYEETPPIYWDKVFSGNTRAGIQTACYSSREDEYYVRAMGHWNPAVNHSISIGAALSHEIFGLDSPGYPHTGASTLAQGDVDDWDTNTWSVLGEYRWDLSSKWTLFVGGRMDKHSYTDWLYSPRAAIIFKPTEDDTLKFIGNQSVRRAGDDELRAQYVADKGYSDSEKIRSGEVRYERMFGNKAFSAISAFYQDIELVAWNTQLRRSNHLADYKIYGIEAEFRWQGNGYILSLSHSYTKLLDFDLVEPGTVQPWSAEPYGYGHSLAIWSENLTKLFASYNFTPEFSVDGSLQIYWGFPGAHDQTRYNNREGTFPDSIGLGLSDSGYDKAFDGNYYLNLGTEYRFTPHWQARLDLFNILGWFDKDLNKRNYAERVSEYRSEAPSLGLSLRYSF